MKKNYGKQMNIQKSEGKKKGNKRKKERIIEQRDRERGKK